MEKKINDLKTASKVISVISKIGYVAMIVALGICASMLIFMGVSGGDTSMLTIGGTNIIFFDETTATPAQMAAICTVLTVMCALLLAVFLLAYKMFNEISQTGKPFQAKFVKTIRVIGILTAATPIALGFVEGIMTAFSKTEIPEMFTDAPGIVVGAIIFCLSYIIDYGCGLEENGGK